MKDKLGLHNNEDDGQLKGKDVVLSYYGPGI